jgi:hypothetical protein
MAKTYEPGTYRAQATEGALGETSKGAPQVAVRFNLLDHENEAITWYGHFTEKTETSTLRALRTAGWKGDDLSDLSDLQSPEAPEVWLVVENETDDQGNIRSKVRWVNSPGGLAMKNAMPADKAKVFAEKMRQKVHALDRGGGAKPRPSNSSGGGFRGGSDSEPSPFNDDIPF